MIRFNKRKDFPGYIMGKRGGRINGVSWPWVQPHVMVVTVAEWLQQLQLSKPPEKLLLLFSSGWATSVLTCPLLLLKFTNIEVYNEYDAKSAA